MKYLNNLKKESSQAIETESILGLMIAWGLLALMILLLLVPVSAAIAQEVPEESSKEEVKETDNREPDNAFEKDWFHIEVIIFENTARGKDSKNDTEYTRKTHKRIFPPNLASLSPYADEAIGPVNEEQRAVVRDSVLRESWVNFYQQEGPYSASEAFTFFNGWLVDTLKDSNKKLLEELDDPDALTQFWPHIPKLEFESGPTVETKPPSEDDYDGEFPFDIPAQLSFRILTEKELILKKEIARLNKHKEYKILLHRAWRQPIFQRENAIAIALASELNSQLQSRLEGYISIEREKFLHVNALIWLNLDWEDKQTAQTTKVSDLDTIAPDKPEAVSADSVASKDISNNANSFVANDANNSLALQETSTTVPPKQPAFLELQESSLIKINALHYLDHPDFGILLKVVPYKANPTEFDLTQVNTRHNN